MINPYRAMCAELVDVLDNLRALVVGECPSLLDGDRGGSGFLDIDIDDALTTARALLAQPEPEGPTDEELWALGSDDFRANYYPTDAIAYARAVLARWGRPEPPSLKEQALEALEQIDRHIIQQMSGYVIYDELKTYANTILKALEALDD